MRNFLLGALFGVSLMGTVWLQVDAYRDLNARLSAVEGYIVGLDRMLRAAR